MCLSLHHVCFFSENWSDILDQSSARDISSNFPEEEPIYSPYNSHQNDILNDDEGSSFLSHFINNLPVEEDDSRPLYRDNSDSSIMMEPNNYLDKITCEVGVDDCPFNSECVPLGLKMRNGICKCIPGMEESPQGACIQSVRPFSKGPTIPIDAIKKDDASKNNDVLKMDTASAKTVQTLTVSILSKQVITT